MSVELYPPVSDITFTRQNATYDRLELSYLVGYAVTNSAICIIAHAQPIGVSTQSRMIDVIKAPNEVNQAMGALRQIRQYVYNFQILLYVKICEMAVVVGTEIIQHRRCGRQRHKVNAPAVDMETYYKLNPIIPALEQIRMRLEERFDPQQIHCTLFRPYSKMLQGQDRVDIPSPQNLQAEQHYWARCWQEESAHLPKMQQHTSAFFPSIHMYMFEVDFLPCAHSE